MRALIDPADSLERQNEKLRQITAVLMRRVEQDTDQSAAAYALFERAARLEDQVRERTSDLERVIDLLNDSNARLEAANSATEAARADLANAIEAIEEGFALFSPDDVLIMCNSRFGMHMPDLRRQLEPGLSFAGFVDAVSRSPNLDVSDAPSRAAWAESRLQCHRDHHVMFNVRASSDHWLQVSEHRTPDGGTVILQTDVTHIMRAEHAARGRLVDSQARMMRATLDHLREGVCVFDAEARIVGWNRRIRDLFDLGPGRVREGMPFEAVLAAARSTIVALAPECGAERLRAWVLEAGGRAPLAFEIRTSAGKTLDALAQGVQDSGFLISFTDVTAERDAARALAEANELLERRVMARTLELEDALGAAERANASKSRFVAAASHDLLQPLSAAKLYLAALGAEQTDPASRAVAEKAKNALVSVEQIICALLEISKLDSGAVALQVAAVPLDDILRPLADEFAPLAALKGLDFRVVFSGAMVLSDPPMLRRILQNLISNAIRYTEQGRVLVGARRAGRSLRLEVWDTGPGISEEDQNVIFEEFRRLGARASASEGMGLGLAIVERACAHLGHPLSLRSELGRGTGFFVDVELGDAGGGTVSATQGDDAALGLEDTGLIVLLVENDLELRRAMVHLMETWGVSVLAAGDAAATMTVVNEIGVAPDAMLIDYQLDGRTNGLDLLKRLTRRFGAVPARIISASRAPELRERCIEAGAELISKPIDPVWLEGFLCAAQRRVGAPAEAGGKA